MNPWLTYYPATPYLVIADFNGVHDHTDLIGELQASDNWWHYLSNTWILIRREDLGSLQSKLVPLIYDTDRLLVVPISAATVGGWLPLDAWKWLEQQIPRSTAWPPQPTMPPRKATWPFPALAKKSPD